MRNLFNSKNFDIKKSITIFLWVLVGLFLALYILKGCRSFLNYDAAFLVDYASEQIRTKSIFPTDWYETNDIWVYSLVPMINIFIRLGVNLFLSRQIPVLIQTIAIFIFLYKIFYDKKDKYSFWIPGLILLSGISGQITYDLFGDGEYGTLLLWMLVAIWCVQNYLEKNKKWSLWFIGISLTLLTMCSLRFPIYVTAPLIVVIVFLYLENGYKKEYLFVIITMISSSLIGYLLFNYLTSILYFISNYGRFLIKNKEALSNNVRDFFYQLLYLTGSTNTVIEFGFWDLTEFKLDLNAGSPMIVFVFVRLIYLIALFVLPFVLKKKIKDFSLKDKIVYIYTCALFFILLFFLIICGMAEWYKYLIPIIFMLTALFILFYRYNLANIRQKVVFICLVALFVPYSIYVNTMTFYSFEEKKFNDNYYQGITDFLVEHDLSFGYEYIEYGKNIYYLLSDGKVRVDSFEQINGLLYPTLWLNSLNWYIRDEHPGKIFFMREERALAIPCEDKASEVLHYQLDENHSMLIFVFEDSNVLYDYMY